VLEPVRGAGTVNDLITELARLPGIGPKSAQRLAFHILRASGEDVRRLAETLIGVKEKTRLCSVCFNVTDTDPCVICAIVDRDRTTVCIVEQPQDIVALEHTGVYRGLYHVLHGAISPADGIGVDNVRVNELLTRLRLGEIKEVILGTNPNMEGETTAMYLTQVIQPLGIRLTRLARGLPFGSELEYADDVTITRALEGRQQI
jgi:recombination protein RecR